MVGSIRVLRPPFNERSQSKVLPFYIHDIRCLGFPPQSKSNLGIPYNLWTSSTCSFYNIFLVCPQEEENDKIVHSSSMLGFCKDITILARLYQNKLKWFVSRLTCLYVQTILIETSLKL